jgi:DNA-binding NarL/FixJ family response regulator
VLTLLLTGLSEKRVAVQLNLSKYTVHNHAKAIYRKLKVKSRAELLALFIQDGKIPENGARHHPLPPVPARSK